METKFIEGTNKQYSIREDGVVIRNKDEHEALGYLVKDKVSRIWEYWLNGKRIKRFYINTLLKDYFNINIPRVNDYNRPEAVEKRRLKVKREGELHTLNVTKKYMSNNLEIPTFLITDEVHQIYKKKILLQREIKSISTAQERKRLYKQLNNINNVTKN